MNLGMSTAVIITIPSLFALILVVAFTTTSIVLIIKKIKWTNRGTRAESYYSTVGPPLPPVKIEKNMSYEVRLEPWRVANTEVDYDDKSVQPDTSNLHHQHSVPVTVTTTENTAYGTNVATAPEIQAEENVAYNFEIDDSPSPPQNSQSLHEEMISSPAYATNISIAPEIETQTNLAYVCY